jgi:hypothetical protein
VINDAMDKMEYQQGRDSQGNKHDKLSSHFFSHSKMAVAIF